MITIILLTFYQIEGRKEERKKKTTEHNNRLEVIMALTELPRLSWVA